MGLFDEIRFKAKLPIVGAEALTYQTKDTPSQFMDSYEVREDGTLWHEVYDVEDRSDTNADGFLRIRGMMTRTNKHWEPCGMTGEIRFYTGDKGWWIEFSSYFKDGRLQQVNLIEHRRNERQDVLLYLANRIDQR